MMLFFFGVSTATEVSADLKFLLSFLMLLFMSFLLLLLFHASCPSSRVFMLHSRLASYAAVEALLIATFLLFLLLFFLLIHLLFLLLSLFCFVALAFDYFYTLLLRFYYSGD